MGGHLLGVPIIHFPISLLRISGYPEGNNSVNHHIVVLNDLFKYCIVRSAQSKKLCPFSCLYHDYVLNIMHYVPANRKCTILIKVNKMM